MENIVRPRVVLTPEEMAKLQDLLDEGHRMKLFGEHWGMIGDARHLAQAVVALTMVAGEAETLLLACGVQSTLLGDAQTSAYLFPGLEVL